MAEYTPSEAEVSEAVAEWCWSRRMFRPELEASNGSEFDRWLAAHDAEVRADERAMAETVNALNVHAWAEIARAKDEALHQRVTVTSQMVAAAISAHEHTNAFGPERETRMRAALEAALRTSPSREKATDADLIDQWWTSCDDVWAVPEEVMVRFGRDVLGRFAAPEAREVTDADAKARKTLDDLREWIEENRPINCSMFNDGSDDDATALLKIIRRADA